MGSRHLTATSAVIADRGGRDLLVAGMDGKRMPSGGHHRGKARGGWWCRWSVVMERLIPLMCWLLNSEQHLGTWRRGEFKEKYEDDGGVNDL